MKNCEWANHLIDQLVLQGADHFCIAPGSRSTPLALAAARHKKAKLTVHFDERSLGFYALGLGMGSKRPAVLIVTSGTAVGNLLPTVIESHHSHVPLILLTADRPAELRDCGASQTIDQIKLFQNFVRWQTDLPCPDEKLDASFIRAEGAHAVFMAKTGPVHVNCPFREPLYEAPSPCQEGKAQQFLFSAATFDGTELLKDKRCGIILVGRMPFDADLGNIFELSKKLQWPIIGDLYSQVRCQGESIRHFDYLIRSKKAPNPECILHFGKGFVAKALNEWVKGIPTIHVHPHHERYDPFHNCPTRVIASPENFFCNI